MNKLELIQAVKNNNNLTSYEAKYKSYTGKNPKTGESVKVKSKKLPFFKPGKELKERVDNK